jgi:Domain of unknown function DUF11
MVLALVGSLGVLPATAAPTTTPSPLPAHVWYAGELTADLSISLGAYGTNVLGGYNGFPIAVTNLGPSNAEMPVIKDTIPVSAFGGTRYPTTFYCVGSVGSTTGWCGPLPTGVFCTDPAVGQGGTVTCSQASLKPGATMKIIIAVHVGLYLNRQAMIDTATVSSATFDPDTANNTATVPVT